MPPRLRSLRRRLVLPVTLVAGIVGVSTLGYAALWRDQGATVLDALYMTVITITTVGYREVHPLDDTGRIFTMLVAVTACGVGGLRQRGTSEGRGDRVLGQAQDSPSEDALRNSRCTGSEAPSRGRAGPSMARSHQRDECDRRARPLLQGCYG
jgi:hypothetical protein